MKRRNTPTQAAVLALFTSPHIALSHEMVAARLELKANRSTIYRILNRFVDDGLLHRIVAEDGCQYFAPCREECTRKEHDHDHPHFRCVTCEQVSCLPQPVSIELPAGYEQASVNLLVSGYCADCAAD